MNILPVGPSEQFKTVYDAYWNKTSDEDIIELRADIEENVGIVGNGSIGGIRSDSTRRTWTSKGGAIFYDVGGSCKISNIRFLSGPTVQDVVYIDHNEKMETVLIEDCVFEDSGRATSGNTSGLLRSNADELTGGPNLIVNRCDFIGCGQNKPGAYSIGFYIDQLWSETHSHTIMNCLFRNFKGIYSGLEGALCEDTGSPDSIIKVYNNTFCNNYVGIRVNLKTDLVNNIFAGNRTDIDLSDQDGNFSKSEALHNAWEQQTDDGGWGEGNIFGINSNNEFDTAFGNDFYLKPNAKSKNSGLDLYSEGVIADFANNPRPQGHNFDIGAYEFKSASQSSK